MVSSGFVAVMVTAGSVVASEDWPVSECSNSCAHTEGSASARVSPPEASTLLVCLVKSRRQLFFANVISITQSIGVKEGSRSKLLAHGLAVVVIAHISDLSVFHAKETGSFERDSLC